MASSSVSQDDVENDFELSSRRSRIRTARARTVNPTSRPEAFVELDDGGERDPRAPEPGCLNLGSGYGASLSGPSSMGLPLGHSGFPAEHDASPKPLSRTKDKRANRPNHMNKGKQQRDRRKLREKRRSTGVVHLPSTESTGGSTGEDEDETATANAETRRNTQYNEALPESATSNVVPMSERVLSKSFASRRNKSPSDLDADDEDNQEFDSLNQSDSTVSSLVHQVEHVSRSRTTNGRPSTPTGENVDEQLERAREENRRLLSLLEDRDHKITVLESTVSQLQSKVSSAGTEQEKLREENAALVVAMTALAAK